MKFSRWALWKEHYNFAAVPPGDDGKRLERNLLDAAWESYGEHLSYIKAWRELKLSEFNGRLFLIGYILDKLFKVNGTGKREILEKKVL